MKISVDLTFSVPIWRFFYEDDDKYKIPYEFIYEGKKYTNGICIIQFACNITEKRLLSDKNFLNETLSQNARNLILCAPTLEILYFVSSITRLTNPVNSDSVNLKIFFILFFT